MSRSTRLLLLVVLVFVQGFSRLMADTPSVSKFCPGSSPEVHELLDQLMEYKSADWTCEPEAWTTMSRLPAVRMIVYDPVATSFTYVSVCPNEGHNTDNLDYLDRRRLNLPTQKIRLLILPYNPADGEVVIETVDGNGIEIEETAAAATPPPPSPAQPTTPEEKKEEKKKEAEQVKEETKKKPSPPAPTEKTDAESLMSAVGATPVEVRMTRTFEGWVDELEKTTTEEVPQPDDLLVRTEHGFEAYYKKLDEDYQALNALRSNLDCADRHVADVPRAIGLQLANPNLFTVAQDPTLCATMEEVLRRQNLIREKHYASCLGSTSLEAAFEDDSTQLSKELLRLTGEFAQLDRAVRALSDNVQSMAGLSSSSSIPTQRRAAWLQQVRRFRQQVSDAREFQDVLDESLPEVGERLAGIHASYASLHKAQASRAPLQRKNYKPLRNGKSMMIKVKNRLPDGHFSNPVAELEMMSAPAYNLRFGMGIIASGLGNPSFKAGPDEIQADGTTKKRILFAEEENNQILPVITIHHYWGKRSPLLTGTWFERVMPSLTLGIPVAKANVLEQAIFGLTWDLTPGVDLSMGVHVGKVNALAEHHVGDPIDPKLDVTTIQKKKYDQAFYFGVLLNSDLFGSLFNAQRKP